VEAVVTILLLPFLMKCGNTARASKHGVQVDVEHEVPLLIHVFIEFLPYPGASVVVEDEVRKKGTFWFFEAQ
jgi:hypothetical protein